jgi:hypothetical protein
LEIEAAFLAYLKSIPALQTLISGKIYPGTAKDATPPFVVYDLITGIDDHCMGDDPDSAEDSYQFMAVSKSKIEANNISKAINTAFKDFSGIMGGENGVQVDSVLQTGRRDDSDTSTSTPIYSRTEDFTFLYHKQL